MTLAIERSLSLPQMLHVEFLMNFLLTIACQLKVLFGIFKCRPRVGSTGIRPVKFNFVEPDVGPRGNVHQMDKSSRGCAEAANLNLAE